MKYIANPVEVDAFRIMSVSKRLDDPNWYVTVEGGNTMIATAEMTSRMTPVPGDYWVVQSDGYVYLNPKAVFERKYSPKAERVEAA